MKALKTLAVLAAVAAIWACNKDNNPTPDPKPTPDPEVHETISVSPLTVTFEAEGGTLRAAVTASAGDYTVTGNPEWLTISKNGAELTLTATANTEPQERTCDLVIKGNILTTTLPVTQKAGSPYPGYTVLKSATMEYGGTMLYQFMKPSEEDYGGWATLGLEDEDENYLVFWIYTDLFTCEEDVVLSAGTYVKGADDYLNLSLCAKKITYMAGVMVEDDEESYATGSYFTVAATEQQIPLVDGTIEVVPADAEGEYLIKVDMIDAEGKAYKYVYTGVVTIDASGAVYPGGSDRIDVANTVFGADCYYLGDTYENGTSNFQLMIFSGDEENYATTIYEFNTSAVAFSEDIDLSGMYTTPVEEEGQSLYDAGTIVPGYIKEISEGFSFPFGTYIMYDYGDYLIGDAYDSLMLTKEQDGTYTINMGSIMSADGEFVMFMNVTGLSITIYDESGE